MENCTYLVSAARQNFDILSINSLLSAKYWPDCPYKKVAVINDNNQSAQYDTLKYDKIILSGQSTNSITRIEYALTTIKTPYILLTHDDFLLYSPVNTKRIQELLLYMKNHNFTFLSLAPVVPNPYPYKDKEKLISEIPYGTAYRYNFQAGIWEKEFLSILLNKYKSIWDFERMAAFDTEMKNSIVLQTDYSGLPYIESVGRGKWRPHALYMLANECIYPDLKKRNMQSDFDILQQSLKGFIFNLNREIITKFINLFNCGYKIK